MEKLQTGNTKIVLHGHLILDGSIYCLTGLHIGGATETIEIGGIDKYIIRNPLNNEPYIPGSSLKGKLRSILEKVVKINGEPLIANRKCDKDGKIWRHECDDFLNAKDCMVCRVFGATGKESENDNFASKIIVSDCELENKEELKREGLYITEAKMENTLDRLTGAASPRTFERIPAGAKFKFRIIYKLESYSTSNNELVINFDDINEDIKNIFTGISVLEKEGLGGNVSRGYGRVKFEINCDYKPLNSDDKIVFENPEKKDVNEVLNHLNNKKFFNEKNNG